MRALVAGASGFIGHAVARALQARGHDVTALVRRPGCAPAGTREVAGDVLDPRSLAGLEADAVFHLAAPRTERQARAIYERTDVEGARNLVAALPPGTHVLYASTYYVYGSSPGSLDETSPVAPRTSVGRVKARVESVLAPLPRSTIFRVGVVYPGGGFGRQVVDRCRRGLLFLPGDGANRVGMVSVDDVAGAFVWAAEREVLGVLDLVDDRPIPFRRMAEVVARALGRRTPRGAPRWLARLYLGRDLAEMALADLAVSNARLRATGFALLHPTFEEGFPATLPEPGP